MIFGRSMSTLQRFCRTYLFDINNTKLHRQLSVTPLRQLSVTPQSQFLVTPLRQFSVTPQSQYLVTPLRQFLVTPLRQFSVTPNLRQEDEEGEEKPKIKSRGIYLRDPINITLEGSMQYIDSEAYKNTYGDLPVWHHYRRNFKGHFPPRKTRKYCIRNGHYATNHPCPVCRDDHLIVAPENVKLLKQFVLKQTLEVMDMSKTHVCQTVQKRLIYSVAQAKDCGYLEAFKPHRVYNYDDYYELANMKKPASLSEENIE